MINMKKNIEKQGLHIDKHGSITKVILMEYVEILIPNFYYISWDVFYQESLTLMAQTCCIMFLVASRF